MFLATTALSEFWNLHEELLFLGPWCLLYNKRNQLSGLKYRILASPWRDREKLHQAYQYCQDLYEELLGDLGRFLNRVHGVEFAPRYWRILLGPWLLYFIDAYYDRYICLQEARHHCPNFDTWLLDEQDYQVPFDTDEFISLVKRGGADFYNLQLYSQILRSFNDAFPARKIEKKDFEPGVWQRHVAVSRLPRCNEFFKVVRKVINRWVFSRAEIFLHYSTLNTWQDMLRVALAPGFNGGFLLADDLPPWRGSLEEKTESRQALIQCSHRHDPFRKILIENLPWNFPRLYLEGFSPWRGQFLQAWEQKEWPKILVDAGGLWLDEAAKLLAAEMTERKGKILSFQHGGSYGSARLMRQERHERRISNQFACWGWAGQEQEAKLINLPAPKLAIRERKPGVSQRVRNILLVGVTFSRYLTLFQSHPLSNQILQYIQDLLIFLSEIGETGRSTTLYRGYPVELGWHTTQRVQDRFPEIALDDHSQPFPRRLQEVRLVVLDYPDTTLLETMVANVPLVLFFNSQVWEQREAAVRYFELLRRVGILQDTPEDAARQVRKIYDRVDEWWFSDEVQATRGEFVQHFARASRKWPQEWAAWLRRELDGLRA